MYIEASRRHLRVIKIISMSQSSKRHRRRDSYNGESTSRPKKGRDHYHVDSWDSYGLEEFDKEM